MFYPKQLWAHSERQALHRVRTELPVELSSGDPKETQRRFKQKGLYNLQGTEPNENMVLLVQKLLSFRTATTEP